MIKNKKTLFALLLLAVPAVFSAQTNGCNSPYSRYGLGALSDQSEGASKAMGGLSQGIRNSKQINFLNPASYSAVDSLTFLFDVGLSLYNNNLNYGGQKINAKNTTFDYMTVAFRAWKNVGMSIGLIPFSSIGYDFSTTTPMEDIDGLGEKSSTIAYKGDGGLHQVYYGIGFSPIKNLSIGANASYLWGDYSHSVVASYSETAIYSLARYYKADLSTYKLDLGLQYGLQLNKNNRLTIGATYGLGHKIASPALFINQKLNSNTVVSGDTSSVSNAFELPHTFGLGLAWASGDKFVVGADYSCQLWSKAKFPQLSNSNVFDSQTGAFSDRHKITIGGEYLPNVNSIHYGGHIRYRAGFSYTSPYAKINGSEGANTYAVTFGVGLPIMNTYTKRNHPVINISAGWEHVKPKVAGLITENYLRLSIGLTFNEKWFQKWKVE
ncbi:MAG: hypothetical protein RR280_05255 [Bacteroidaceae bacterium]